MENPQAQMPQGQPGQAPQQMQQGQPQQGGQDQQMQQVMQYVQQQMQQGAQPVDVAIQLIQQGLQPDMIMQVFVQMGMNEEEARESIESAMEGGQQEQGTGEETLEGNASNADEEMVEQSTSGTEASGQSSPAEEIQMRYGGGMPRRLRSFAEGGDNQELQAVMQQVQEMMQGGSDARQVMEQIQQAAQQGKISPETATAVLDQLGGMQQASNPQGDDAGMAAQSQDPQMMDPNMAAPDSAMGMMKFGGNLKKLMSRAYGGAAVAPGTDSKTYAQDRAKMFVDAVKNNAFKSTLDDEFPSLGGNQMAYGGDLPKAVNGFDVTKYKTADEAELAARRYAETLDPEKAKTFDWKSEAGKWKEPEFKFEAGKAYELDPATGKPRVINQTAYPYQQQQYVQGYGAVNPVQYQNPMGNGVFGNMYAGASPFARMVAGFGTNNQYDPRITGANLPGGMSGSQFLGAVGANGLVPGMAGNVAGQNWRIGEAEKFKEGSIWKGNRRKGVRYQIDWGNANAINPATVASAPTSNNASGYVPNAAGPGYSGFNADANGDGIPDYLGLGTTTMNATGNTQNQSAASLEQMRIAAANAGVPMNTNLANQTLVAPGSTDVVNPASEVNQVDQSANAINSYPKNNQGQAPFASQSMMAAEPMMQNTETPAFVPNQTYMNFADPRNTSVPAQFIPAPDVLPAGTENTNVIKQPVVSGNRTIVKKNPVVAPVKTVAAPVVNSNKPSSEDYQKRIDAMEREDIGLNADKIDKFTKLKEQALAREAKEKQQAQLAATRAKSALKTQKQQEAANRQTNNNLNSLAYGGNVDPAALENAINLINRAFGGMIPKALDGMNLGSEDKDANKIPDYLQFENLPGNSVNSGTIEQSAGKKMNIDWNQVGAAAGDMYMNSATKATNFFNKMNTLDPEREQARYSAMNRASDSFESMSQGQYDDAGNYIPNSVGNQVFNSTDSNYNNQPTIYAYGGRVYEIGGDVDLDDDEMEQLAAAGFKFSRV